MRQQYVACVGRKSRQMNTFLFIRVAEQHAENAERN